MQFLNQGFRQALLRSAYDDVNAAKMVDGLYDIIYSDCLVGNADGAGLIDKARLVMCESAAFNVIAIVGQVYLRAVVDAAFEMTFLLLAQGL